MRGHAWESEGGCVKPERRRSVTPGPVELIEFGLSFKALPHAGDEPRIEGGPTQ